MRFQVGDSVCIDSIPADKMSEWMKQIVPTDIYTVVETDPSDSTLCLNNGETMNCWVFENFVTLASTATMVVIDGVEYSTRDEAICRIERDWYLKSNPLIVQVDGRWWVKTNEKLVIDWKGVYRLKANCISHDRKWYSKKSQQVFEYNDKYYHISNGVTCYGNGNVQRIVPKEFVIEVDGNLYDVNYINQYGYRQVYETGNYALESSLYRWNDGYYHNEREHSIVYDYHGMSRIDLRNPDTTYSVGFEIEKAEKPSFKFYREDLYNIHKMIIERDGSVPNGFEIVTPTFDLFDPTLEKQLECIRGFCDVPDVTGCGGHIHFGIKGVRGDNTLKRLQGWLPMIYSMYRGRANNDYSIAKKVQNLLDERERRQSVRILDNHIEFRIISAVYTYETLLWRIGFLRIMTENITLPFEKVLLLALNKKSKLNKHLMKVYDTKESLFKMLESAVKFHTELEGWDVKSIEAALKKMASYKFKKPTTKAVVEGCE